MPLEDVDYRLKTVFTPSAPDVPFTNVWYYKRTSGTGLADVLNTRWIATVLPALEDIISSFAVGNITLFAENLLNLDDIDTASTTLTGGWTGVSLMPSFVTATFRLNRSTRQNKRHGRKAFGPLDENMMDAGVPTTGYGTALAAMAVAMESTLVSGTTGFKLALPQSIKVENDNPPPAEVYQIQNLFVIGDVDFSHISTQNSRKTF